MEGEYGLKHKSLWCWRPFSLLSTA